MTFHVTLTLVAFSRAALFGQGSQRPGDFLIKYAILRALMVGSPFEISLHKLMIIAHWRTLRVSYRLINYLTIKQFPQLGFLFLLILWTIERPFYLLN